MIISEEEFIRIISKNSKVKNDKLLRKAYLFAKEAHKEQKRDSGEPYFIHPLEIAISISELKLDENSIIAGLLHDVVEDTRITLNDIEKNFGEEIAYLVDGLTKIDNIEFKSKTEKNAENFRKLILATAKDVRVLIIKLLDRLNNMNTLSGISDDARRKRIAEETLTIYVPLAERIGMYKFKLELEDLCFKELFPNEREKITKGIKKVIKNKKDIIDEIIKKLSVRIKIESKIDCKILGREKMPYSIWKKMQKRSISFERIFDIIAFRIIVKDTQTCYKVLGVINSNYVLVPDTFKDYISKPKPNGYQSIHIVVIGPKFTKIEIQIRTEDMDELAEYGVASHWIYKEDIKDTKDLEKYNYIREIVRSIEDTDYNSENYENIKSEIKEDEVFCYTPKGDIINLPIGSTGIDFAYAIHKDLGNRCSGIKINGLATSFKTTLNNGDEIEIITSKSYQVNEDWLNFVKTNKAKAEIKSFIRSSRLKELEKIGRETANNLSKNLKTTITDNLIEKNISKFNQGKFLKDIYVLIADNKIKTKELIKVLFNKQPMQLNQLNSNLETKELENNTAYKYAKCCYPIPPNEIVGVVDSNKGITVHKKNCLELEKIKDNRIIDLKWDSKENSKYVTKLIITLDGKPGILAKVINSFAEKQINIVVINTINEFGLYQEIELKIEVKNEVELENFKASLRNIEGVMEISNE